MAKPIIFYCDDQQVEIDRFIERHKNNYEIVAFTDEAEFKSRLQSLVGDKRPPEIILIDLFHPKNDERDEDAEQAAANAKDRLGKVIEETRQSVYKAFSPDGVQMLETARVLCPNTPIALYARYGTSLISDDDLDKISKQDGMWLLKGRRELYEQRKLEHMLNQSQIIRKEKARAKEKMARISMNIFLAIGAVFFVAPFLYAWWIGKFDEFMLATLASVPFLIISWLFRRYSIRQKKKEDESGAAGFMSHISSHIDRG